MRAVRWKESVKAQVWRTEPLGGKLVASRRRLAYGRFASHMPRHRLHTPLCRLALATLFPLLASAGCGGSTSEPASEPTPKPTPPPPARVVIVTSPKTTGIPSEVAGTFSVRVEDAAGRGMPGVHVRFASRAGARFGPSDAATTDSTGVAWAVVTFGTVAGPDLVSATADGLSFPAWLEAVVVPGPPMWLRFRPEGVTMELFDAGDSVAFQAFVVDAWNNVIVNAPFDFRVSDPTLISVTPPATQGGDGWIRSLRGGGSAVITSAAVQQSLGVWVNVFSRPRTACTGVAAPQELAIGVSTTVTDSLFCLAAHSAASEYELMMYNGSTDGATSLGTTVTAYNIGAPLSAAQLPSRTPLSLSRSATLLSRSSAPTMDLRFHERLLERNRPMRRLFAASRAVRSSARRTAGSRIAGPRLSYSLVGGASVPAINDLIALNVADAPCTNADMRTFRVEAVGDKSIVLADTANPGGGFTRADYQRFAARFDTLVYPLDRDAFGDPSDIDGNGRVAILFTRAVNELTPANSGSFVGGFFHPRDLFPRTQSTVDVCATSNEGELVYLMVPDPAGAVNGNRFRLGMVDTLTTAVLTHELQHLINASRRMYVNTAAQDFEETWLNEGLSHIAEELLYFRESGLSPRWGLTAQWINDTWAHFAPWVSDDASNFQRFYLYLLDPANHSPIDAGDELEIRGASWAFLRYAVDRSYSSDGGVWQRFGNSTTTGLATLTFGLQRDPKPLLRDFAAANLTGEHPSWNYASVYTKVFASGKYPLAFGRLQDGKAVPVSARGGSASYYKFGVSPGTQTLVKFGSSNANLTFMLVRRY